MNKLILIVTLLSISFYLHAGPILQMNKAFSALSDLVPFMTDRDAYMKKENEKQITGQLVELQKAFSAAKHNTIIKEDLFAPSYALINENIAVTLSSFKSGKKDFSHWQLKNTASLCIDCHTRMPPEHTSSFQNGENFVKESKFQNAYSLGIAQMIVRRYVDAKASFIRSIQESFIKKDFKNVILPFKQILLIETKVLKNPNHLIGYFTEYSNNNQLPPEIRATLRAWIQRVQHWQKNKLLNQELKSDADVWNFVKKVMLPLKNKPLYDESYEVDLLVASGILSNYLFIHPETPVSSEITFWIGWTEKFLKREEFYGSGDLFLRQCLRKYYREPVAKRCLEEYQESVIFEFSGSSGTHIPKEVQKELDDFSDIIRKNQKQN